MKNKRYICYILFIISMIMLIVPLVPHHHHTNGVICMKHDVVPEEQCPAHSHHQENDSCCSNECLARFFSPAPGPQTVLGPQHMFVAILFTDFIIENLLRPQKRQFTNAYVYRESLHGTNITRAFGLRAPPYTFA